MADTGGIDGTSFGAGYAAASASLTGLGAWLWRILGRSKDEQIALLIKRIEHLEKDYERQQEQFERTLSDDRARCDRHINGLNDRIRLLESMTLGGVRQATQRAVSEIRTQQDRVTGAD